MVYVCTIPLGVPLGNPLQAHWTSMVEEQQGMNAIKHVNYTREETTHYVFSWSSLNCHTQLQVHAGLTDTGNVVHKKELQLLLPPLFS